MERLSIGIAGAGPAGLAVAVLLARQGHAVTIADRFVAPGPVGSGLMLQPTGLAVLAALSLDGIARDHGKAVRRILGKRVGDERTVLDVRYGGLGLQARALAIHRSALFGLLFQAVQVEGVNICAGFEVADAPENASGRYMANAEGERLGPFDLVIDALGSRSPLASSFVPVRVQPMPFGALWATVPWPGAPFLEDALEQRYHRASMMVGVLPVGRRWGEGVDLATFFWSLKGSAYENWRGGDFAGWKADVRRAWPRLEPLLDHLTSADDLTFARYRHHTLARPFASRLVAIGDAAHSTSPQLGQGANMALLDAWVLAEAIKKSAPSVERALTSYAARRRWHVRLYQALSYRITPLYQSDHPLPPMLRDYVLRPLALAPFAPPILAATVSGLVLAPRVGRSLV